MRVCEAGLLALMRVRASVWEGLRPWECAGGQVRAIASTVGASEASTRGWASERQVHWWVSGERLCKRAGEWVRRFLIIPGRFRV